MCGRIALFTPPAHLARFLHAALAAGLDPDGRPNWNLGPQQRLFAVSQGDDGRVLDQYKWGLVPGWAKDASLGNRLFNARGETVAEKPSFRGAFKSRSCAVPVDGFYEWDHRPGRDKQPNYFTRRDGEPLILAGLYERWHDPEGPSDDVLMTCTIITTAPNEDLDEIHDRMPVVLDGDDLDTWLDVKGHDPAERLELVRPAPKGTLTHYAVGKAVGSIKNNGPQLIEPEASTSLFE